MNSDRVEADSDRGDAAAGYVGVGASLRQSRLEAGQELTDVAESLRIRRVHLEAIEKGRFDDLPGQVYATGFLRAYADHLGLDAEWVLDRFREEVDPREANPDLHFPEPPERSGLRGLWVFAAAAALAAAGYGGWYYTQNAPGAPEAAVTEAFARQDAAPPETGAEVSAPEAAPAADPADAESTDNAALPARAPAESRPAPDGPPAGDSAAPPPGLAVAPDAPLPEALEIAAAPDPAATADSATPDNAAPDNSAAGNTVDEGGAAGEAGAAGGNDAAGNDSAAGENAASGEAAEPPDDGESRVVLRALRLSWVRVRGPDRQTIYARNLEPGEIYRVPRQEGLTLTVGNAGGLEIVVDGRALPPLGAEGAPRIGVSLDPDALLGAAR